MKASLRPHPACPGVAISDDIDVTLERLSLERLRIRFVVTGTVDEIVAPPSAPPLRSDNLWKTTCFEAFIAEREDQAYREFNFSPSSQWAAYDFTGYRHGMVQASVPAPPDIFVERGTQHLVVTVTLSLDLRAESHDVGLAAVIEERSGNISYWALSHPGEVADFHRRDCFVLELPPPGAP